jgi:sortase A
VAGRRRDEALDGRRRSRPLLWTGVALLLAGVCVLGYLGWEVYGTTWVSKREQRSVVDATERSWGQGSVSADDDDDDDELAADVVALVRIPAFGADYVVPAVAGTGDGVLARGFGVFADSAAPGGVGNVAMTGHRITHGEPLRDLPELEAGDQVLVETRDAVYTYVLDTDGDALTVDDDAGWVTAADPVDPDTGTPVSSRSGSQRLLTLVTCAELFHTDERLVAFGHLVSQQPNG